MVKKSLKKKVVRKKSHAKNSSGSVSKKDFEAFKFGVQRLKELEGELKSLDTRGFSKEAQDIKSHLKNVSEIPAIERKLKELKQKINGKYKPKRRKKSPIKEIHEDIEDVKEDLKSFKKTRKQSFDDIKDEIKSLKKKHRISSIPLDSGVDVLVDTNFNDFLVSTKKALSERIRNREEEMDDVLKKDLEKREDKYKKKHENLVKDFERNKEKVEEDYKKKYNKKVESELHKEVANNFRKMLQDKLAKEKIELAKTYKAQLKQHANDELEKEKLKLDQRAEKEFSNKMSSLESKFQKKMMDEDKKESAIKQELDSQKRNLDSAFQKKVLDESKKESIVKKELDSRKKALEKAKRDFADQKELERKRMQERLVVESHKNVEAEIVRKEAVLRKQLQDEYELRLKKQIQEHEQELKKKKIELELQMQKKIKQLLN